MKRLLIAAEKGDPGSQFNLGIMYDSRLDDNNRAIGGNRSEAMKWLARAANQGLPRAQIKLAELYADEGTQQQDNAKACFWFLIAMESLAGFHRERAEAGYRQVCLQLTPVQIAKAQRLTRNWNPELQNSVATAASSRAS